MTDLARVLEMATATHAGKVRSHNEDSLAADAGVGLAVLADGMGGYNAGEVASGIAVAMISAETQKALGALRGGLDVARREKLLFDQLTRANNAIFRASQNQPRYAGMGTTLVAALWYDNHVIVVHVGDSRLYRLRSGRLEQLTRDHSLLQEQIDSGLITREQARHSPGRNLVTRAVGIDSEVEPEVHSYPVEAGDIFLMCSDGLNDMVCDGDIERTLASLQANLPQAAQQLVQQANDNGGKDNVSVILVRVLGRFPARAGFADRMKSWLGQVRGTQSWRS